MLCFVTRGFLLQESKQVLLGPVVLRSQAVPTAQGCCLQAAVLSGFLSSTRSHVNASALSEA